MRSDNKHFRFSHYPCLFDSVSLSYYICAYYIAVRPMLIIVIAFILYCRRNSQMVGQHYQQYIRKKASTLRRYRWKLRRWVCKFNITTLPFAIWHTGRKWSQQRCVDSADKIVIKNIIKISSFKETTVAKWFA